mgnify:CR=1 FL=1
MDDTQQQTHTRSAWIGVAIFLGAIGFLLCCSSSMYRFFDPRPQDLRGTVTCHVIAYDKGDPLFVRVVLDEAAQRQRSQVEIIREILSPSTSESETSRLWVDVGKANGGIDGCGTFADRAFQIDITDQMISYPAWIRIRSRPSNRVLLVIQDQEGRDLVMPQLLEPQEGRYMVQWIR